MDSGTFGVVGWEAVPAPRMAEARFLVGDGASTAAGLFKPCGFTAEVCTVCGIVKERSTTNLVGVSEERCA